MAMVPRMPADFVSLSARIDTPPSRAMASASCALPHAAAEQPVDGHAEGAPVEIPERHLHRRAREGVALHAPGHLDPQWLDARRVAADEPGRDVALEHDLHGLRRLLAPRRAAEARRLAPADETAPRL